MKRIFLLLTFAALLISAAGAQAPSTPDPWAPLRFLIGNWEAKASGGAAQAQSSGTYGFQLDLRDHVLSRHSSTAACKGPNDFDCQHSDLLYIYPQPDGVSWQAIYFDNEGHVLHYAVTVPKPGTVVFLTDSTQPGPQFRLTYELSAGIMTGKFQAKMPGQADFMSYLEWSGKRL